MSSRHNINYTYPPNIPIALHARTARKHEKQSRNGGLASNSRLYATWPEANRSEGNVGEAQIINGFAQVSRY
jgi:hypothetical protein